MDDNKDVYIPRSFRIDGADRVRNIWQKIPNHGGIYVSQLNLKVGKGEQEILEEVVRDWADHNIVKMRNPSNPFISKRRCTFWEHVDCPRCNKNCHSFSQFQEHWKEETRLLAPAEVQHYLAKMKDLQDKY